jgi:hypothetical protein
MAVNKANSSGVLAQQTGNALDPAYERAGQRSKLEL